MVGHSAGVGGGETWPCRWAWASPSLSLSLLLTTTSKSLSQSHLCIVGLEVVGE